MIICLIVLGVVFSVFFFFNDTATTEIYTLSLHDALPISTAIIRRIRPDVLLSVDPGEWYERWHKTDHRMAAFNTIDAVRAAEFWLYFPNQKLQQGLEPYRVPEMYFFYPSPQEANYFVNIDDVAELKFEAAAKQVSQFEPAVTKYRPDWDAKSLEKAKDDMRHEQPCKDG